jgi:hypothetical protein
MRKIEFSLLCGVSTFETENPGSSIAVPAVRPMLAKKSAHPLRDERVSV